MLFKSLRSQHGIGLVETLVATAALGAVALGVAQLTSNQSKQMRVMRTMSTRDEVHVRVARFAGNGRALVNTAKNPANAAFNNCTNSVLPTAGPCDATTIQPLTLVDDESTTNIIGGPGPSPPLTPYPPVGTIGTPQLYDQNGAKCSGPPSAKCGIAVYTMFRANCGVTPTPPYTDLPNCAQAKSVTVMYRVMQVVPSLGGDTPVLQLKEGNVPSTVPLNITAPSGVTNFLAKWDTGTSIGVSTLIYEAPPNPPAITTPTIGVGTMDPSLGGGVGSFFTIDTPVNRATGFAIARNGTQSFAINPQADGSAEIYDSRSGWRRAITLSSGNVIMDRDATVGGSVQVNSNLNVSGTITGGTVNGTSGTIGSVSMSSGTMSASAASISGGLTAGSGTIGTVSISGGSVTATYMSSNSADIGSVNLNGGNVTGTAFFYTSDERLKQDVKTIPNALERTKRLRGILFRWRESKKADLGFLAQEVEKEFPELVKTDPKTGFKSVDYGHLVAVLVEAIKEQDAALSNFESRLEAVEKKLDKNK